MKRAKLKDRVRLLAYTRGELLVAAKVATEAVDSGVSYRIRDASTQLEMAALEYGKVAIRYLGGVG